MTYSTKNTRVCFLLDTMRRGAVVSILLSLIKYMPSNHIRFWVVSLVDFDVDSQEAFRAMGVQTIQLQCNNRGWLQGLLEFYSILKKHSFNVIHCHLSKAIIIGLCFGRWFRIPYRYITLHNVWEGHKRYFRRLFPVVKYWSTKCFYVSYTVLDSFPGYLSSECNLVIHNPIDRKGLLEHVDETQCTRLREEFDLQNQFVLVSVGRLIPQKNHDLLLRIFKRFLIYVPNSKLLIVGQGILKDKILSKINKLGLQQQVICTGFRRDVLVIIKIANVVVNPSYSEGFSITMLESMALGTPFVGSKITSFEECITSGKNGFLVGGDNPDQYAKILYKLYSDPQLRKKISENANQKVLKYDAEKIAKRYGKFYNIQPQ